MNTALYAIICTWNEEDIIASTVRHAFAQGCDKVFVVDNGSSDATLERALAAGAIHQGTFITRYFNEDSKIMALNNAVSSANAILRNHRAWWLYIDADEFPTAPGFATIREFLASLPGHVRAVKSRMINHYPTHQPYFWEGFHPIDFQPWGRDCGVSKFQLLRYDFGKEHIISLGGAHDYFLNSGRLPESNKILNLHHFNFRAPEVAQARLTELGRVREDGTTRLDWMDNFNKQNKGSGKCMYHARLANLEASYSKNQDKHLLAPAEDFWDFAAIPRWYSPDKLYEAVEQGIDCQDSALFFVAHHLFLRGEYDQALVCFDRIASHLQNKGESAALPLYYLACCFQKDGDLDTARRALSEAISARPELNLLLKIKEALISCTTGKQDIVASSA